MSRDTSTILDQFTRPRERDMLDQLSAQAAEANWPTRLWCAKEAAGKALGIGLAGRPKDLEMLEYEEDGSFLIQHGPTGERVVVLSADVDSFLLAWTARDGATSSPHGAAEEVPGMMQRSNP